MKTYDVLVLGGGTGGSAAAKAAHGAGARTAMFNDGELGGLCILKGCMPTKTMLHSAHVVHHAQHHGTRGVAASSLAFDFADIMANKDVKVARFQAAKIASIESGGYDVIDARARFVGPDTVEAGGDHYRFSRGAVIATGSTTVVPPFEGIDSTPFWTSDTVMALTELPESLIVVGTGAIGLELAQFFARLGTRVELISRRCILEDVDPLIAEEMRAALDDEPGLTAHHGARVTGTSPTDAGVEVTYEMGDATVTTHAAALLLATGRRANLDGLGLEAAGVDLDDRGRIAAGPDMRTTNQKVFVAGDASGQRLLLHVANWEGRAAGLGAAGEPGEHAVEQRLHLEVVFYDPPLATIGMNEREARQAGHEVVTAAVRFPETGRAITMDARHGVCKLVGDRVRGEILGAQILGPRADDLVHVVAAVMYYRGTARQMLEMPWYHPTLSEVLLGLAREIDIAAGS